MKDPFFKLRVQLSEENNKNLNILEFFVGHFRLARSRPGKLHRYNVWLKTSSKPDELEGRRGFNYNSYIRQCSSFFLLNSGRKTNQRRGSFTVVTSSLRSSQDLISKNHLLVHTQQTPFSWSYCWKLFSGAPSLDAHLRSAYWRETL